MTFLRKIIKVLFTIIDGDSNINSLEIVICITNISMQKGDTKYCGVCHLKIHKNSHNFISKS